MPVPPEDEFVEEALEFLAEIGADTSAVEPQTDLIETGVLDSLGTLAFLEFLEQRRAADIAVDTLDISAISSLRGAHKYLSS